MRVMRVTATVVLLATALGACGGGSGGDAAPAREALPTAWSAAGQRDARAVAARIRAAQPGACTPLRFLAPGSLEGARDRYGWNIAPRALGDCDVSGESIEIGVFADAADRAAFVDERTDGICRRAAAVQAPVPPFVWVTKGDWSIQVDKRTTARRLARTLGGEVSVRPCDLGNLLGWTRRGVTTLRAFEGPLANVAKCGGFGLVDRRSLVAAGAVRTPAAVASCLITSNQPGEDRNVLLAAFDAGSQRREQFVGEVLTSEGACAEPLTAVTGTRDGVDFAVMVPTDLAQAVATALGGQVGRACGG